VVLCNFIFTFLVVGKTEENSNKHSPNLVFSSFLCEWHFGRVDCEPCVVFTPRSVLLTNLQPPPWRLKSETKVKTEETQWHYPEYLSCRSLSPAFQTGCDELTSIRMAEFQPTPAWMGPNNRSLIKALRPTRWKTVGARHYVCPLSRRLGGRSPQR